ncbi:MAG: DegT/DnrJ/EryC1/StrS family aminotransferase [Bdellovibrionales bacterium]
MSQHRVPYVNFPQQFKESREETMAAIEAVMARGDFILGKEVGEFEDEFAKLCGVKHAVSVANGTDSLIISLRIFGVGPGDEVITTSNSWISSASSIALIGATPVFVDVDEDQNMDPKLLEKAITKKTKCIMPVHLTGRCARMPEILEIAKKHGIPVLEDAAQAVGAVVGGIKAGAGGELASFSLHPLKNLNAVGDAGIITTNDVELASKVKMWRNHGMRNRDEIDFWGYNSRLDTVQAAVLKTRLTRFPQVIERRRELAKRYVAGLADVVKCPIERDDEFHTYHVFVVQCDKRNGLQAFLSERGIETKIHYPIPIHMQRCAKELGYKKGDLPVTETQSERILSLPINQYLQNEQVDFVIESIREFYQS